jgi:uncharacterized membrane protein
MLAVYGLPLGLMAAGVLIPRIDYARTITVFSVTGLVLAALIAVRWREALWREPITSSRP